MSAPLTKQQTTPPSGGWPVLTRYEGTRLTKVALPIGGIGTGTISLGGRGNLHDFEVGNRPAKGFTPENCFFLLRAEQDGEAAVTRALEGPLPDHLFEGGFGSPARGHGLPRFRACAFEAAYPLGRVLLSDPAVPLTAAIEAFNPLIPPDSDRSGIPVAVLRIALTNPGDRAVSASVCGCLKNFCGDDGTSHLSKENRNAFRESGGVAGILLEPGESVAKDAESWGTLALAVADASGVTHRTAWAKRSWGDSLLDFWDDFAGDGRLDERDGGGDQPIASLAASVEVPAGESRSVTFLIGWHFPNRFSWTGPNNAHPVIGNYYTGRYKDAWEVAEKTAADLPALERETVAFVRAFCESDLPQSVKEAALNNVSSLRTQTCFRTPDGRLYGWEGCGDKAGCCHGSCTHVWNYEVTTPFLFGDLARTMREVEFAFATELKRGHMGFRVPLPLTDDGAGGVAAADGQMGCIMKLYRDWRLSGDDTLLERLWSGARKSLEFCWIEGGWDADRDGVMEGCQHNTMDVEYYGPNPQMGTWYLGALRAAEEMATHRGDGKFAAECRRLFENGSRYMDEVLFNGEYYEHHIVPPGSADAIAPGLRHPDMGARDLANPELQLGAGCLIDQLAGQYMAHVCGLGYLLKLENVRKTLASLMRYNFQESLWGHFNHLRTFALQDESAMLMASYPLGRRLERPFPYYNEVMTGFEHTAAAHMLYEGETENGLRLIDAIRARYDGARRSPFDEAECGHHYARAMAAWAHVLALTGMRWDGVTGELRLAPLATGQSERRDFWSTGHAWGTAHLRRTNSVGGAEVTLTIGGGTLPLVRLSLAAPTAADAERSAAVDRTPLAAGDTVTVAL